MAGIQTLLSGWVHATGGTPTGGLSALEPTRRVGNRVEYDLTIEKTPFEVAGRQASAITMNGTVPGPLIRLQEGDEAVLRHHSKLEEDTSIHWHGLLLPNQFDGVPEVNYSGVAPGETFEAGLFEVRPYGTYWCHSHSGLQEQLGHDGPLARSSPRIARGASGREAWRALAPARARMSVVPNIWASSGDSRSGDSLAGGGTRRPRYSRERTPGGTGDSPRRLADGWHGVQTDRRAEARLIT